MQFVKVEVAAGRRGTVSALTFIVVLVVGIFAFEGMRQWWRQNEWRRRWKDDRRDDD